MYNKARILHYNNGKNIYLQERSVRFRHLPIHPGIGHNVIASVE